ncbi:DUF500-domain-containing protein [Dentipellis sp. KUC8613]|nr:DUF500-domain-containing protein [Dentipellis sp. KUC8613]
MKLNSPLPQPLPKECAKAANIFKSFVDSSNNGLDGVIPRSVLENARGFAIFSIFKAGFLFSARAGSGVVIARTGDGSWSAPSAIGIAGVGFGGQAGAEMTDFLVVLNSHAAVRSFMAAGSLTLGGNMSLAVGPLGRNGEASGALNTSGKMAAMFSYSKTRGLFGGVSLEGSAIVERQDANALAYHSDVSARQLLSGSIDIPEWAQPLIRTLENCTGRPGGRHWVQDSANPFEQPADGYGGGNGYAFSGIASPGSDVPPSLKKNKKKSSFPPASWGSRKDEGSYFSNDAVANSRSSNAGRTRDPWDDEDDLYAPASPASRARASTTASFPMQFESDFQPDMDTQSKAHPHLTSTYSSDSSRTRASLDERPRSATFSGASHNRSFSSPSYGGKSASRGQNGNVDDSYANPFAPTIEDDDPFAPGQKPVLSYTARQELKRPLPRSEGVARAIAQYDFRAVQPGDLPFIKGDVITITEKTDNTDTWWKGRVNGKEGSFPANFVELV